MNIKSYLPFLRWYPKVNRGTIKSDVIAGLTGAIVVLPQGIAFATIAGMPPEYGLYAGMLPAIIAALFGSSWHLVSGPTTVASVVLFSVLSPLAEPGSLEYVKLALLLTCMVGILQLFLGLARMGSLVNLISHTVLVGFTAGAAVLIMISQLKFFFGIDIERSKDAYFTLWQLVTNADDADVYVTIVAIFTLLTAIFAKKYLVKVPYMLVSLAVGCLVAWLINYWYSGSQGVQLVSTVRSLPSGLPPLSMPALNLDIIAQLAPAALAITLLALTESISIARSLALKSGQNIDADQEFVGQGLSNIIGSFFSAYVATGSFNRSAMNYEAGAKTPVAAIVSGVLLLIIVIAVAPLTSYLPHAAMAGLLVYVGWTLIDFRYIVRIIKTSRSETVVMSITFFSTFIAGLEFAVVFGVLISIFLLVMDTTRPRIFSRIPDVSDKDRRFVIPEQGDECPQLKMVRIDGRVYSASLYYIKKILAVFRRREPEQRHVLLLAQSINAIDISGAEFLIEFARERRDEGGDLYVYRCKDRLSDFLRRGQYLDELGKDNFFRTKEEAIATIFTKLDKNICSTCHRRIFRECQSLPRLTT